MHDGSIDRRIWLSSKNMIAAGTDIGDANVKAYLTRNRQPMSDLEKWSTDSFDPEGDRPFKVTQQVEYGEGFKVKFTNIFYP